MPRIESSAFPTLKSLDHDNEDFSQLTISSVSLARLWKCVSISEKYSCIGSEAEYEQVSESLEWIFCSRNSISFVISHRAGRLSDCSRYLEGLINLLIN